MPYYESKILPHIKAGKNVLIVAHGNSLRALIMHLEKLSADEILRRELATGAPIVYRITKTGKVESRRDLVPSTGRDEELG